MMTGNTDFAPDTDRYAILRRIGAGGMGVVYEAFDRNRGEQVALKTLRWVDAAAIYRFKREFRALSDVAHPNLVSLYELVVDEDLWFFTMELVDGVDFLRYVRPHDVPREEGQEDEAPALPPDESRLRPALEQLTRGLDALHRAGKVHRDLKPSNVLVTPSGRVVVLDFGLAAERTGPGAVETVEDELRGTVAYMSPEQGARPFQPDSDWYAVGVMLYEALTGRLPYTGHPFKILVEKQQRDPEPPDQVVAGLPGDLVTLCMALLERDATRRPSGPEVVRRLGLRADARARGEPSATATPPELVGRTPQLEALRKAFATARQEQPLAVYLHGPSGIGKTTLVEHFLETIVHEAGAVVLAGRCYLRESVPYKALDGIVDALTRYLRTLPREEAAALVPTRVTELVKVFPVLHRVDAIGLAPYPERETQDRVELRRRAIAALRELLANVARRATLVVWVDDLQWADEGSARLMDDLLSPPDAPRMLLLASFRSEEIETRPFLGWLVRRPDGAVRRILELAPLNDDDTRRLINGLLEPDVRAPARYTDVIARESAGNPFLAEQMVRYVRSFKETVDAAGTTLGEMLDVHLEQLPAGAGAVLQTLAVAGHPVPASVAHRAAGQAGDERPLVAALSAARLVRSSGTPDAIEVFHDRIRETVVGRLQPAVRQAQHLRLAQALEADGFDDPEMLFEHYAQAGQHAVAAHHAARAGRKAASELAFDRAAAYFARALEWVAAGAPERAKLLVNLADALSNAGRLDRAAEIYSRAAQSAEPADALEYQRLAAEHLLVGGRIEEGLREVETVLRAGGLRLAATPTRALLHLLWGRLRLKLRGLRFAERPASEVPRRELVRIDVCRTVAEGLAHLDFIRAADFQTRHTHLALRAGEPDRVARALAIESAFATLGGGARAQRRSETILRAAERLAARIDSAHAMGLCALIAGTTAYFQGNWARARESTERAQRMLLEHGVGVAWEIMTARLYHTLSLFYLGELRALGVRAHEFLADAQERGNRFAATIYRTGPANAAWLAADDSVGARAVVREALEQWPDQPFRTPHYLAMTAEARIRLYRGEVSDAWDAIMRRWPDLESTRLMRIQAIRVIMLHIRGRCAVAQAGVHPGEQARLLAEAERDAARIERARRDWCLAMAALLRASIARARGEMADTATHLREAIAGLDRTDMKLHAAAARYRLADLVGGTEGAELRSLADQWAEAQQVRNPARLTAMAVPGFPD